MVSREPSAVCQLLLLLILKDSLGSSAGTHTLRYDLMALSQEGSGQAQFLALGYLDDELFLRYDGDNRRAEPLGLRMKRYMGAEPWARETEDLQEKEQQLRRMLAELMGQKGQDRGLHSLQATLGCELQGTNTGGFWRLGYDGQDFLTFDLETLRWKETETSEKLPEAFLETYGPTVDQVKNFLNNGCPARLWGYLNSLKDHLEDTGPLPIVTRRNYPVGRITLTCQAFNLYPPITTLIWLRDGKPVQQRTFGPGTILPNGDGTYQTWVSMWILPGEEPWFSCHMQHGSHSTTVSAVFGHQAKNTDGTTNTAATLAVSVLPAILVMLTWT
ncbi:MHC class I polypeptide-related sequence B-like [Nannospalax galili]|uniref:MHC class I polypeptide-related sequence B-like n=1 Tax=Nannospalax galili TaxID=1026970 RepID=UPI00111BD7FD|nr:MHC class I polypeptide-related sequence B-like [Nannospalax galili]